MAEQTLTAADLARYTEALADGKKPLVYLVEGVPSLGLASGASARVVEVDGDTVTVKPTGVDDRLPYEARELRATKQPKPVKRAPRTPAKAAAASSPAAKAPGVGSKGAGRAARSVAVTVYVGADNTASLKVTRNAQKPQGAQEIPLPTVHKALAALGDKEARDAVDEVLSAAREAAADRVAALQAELAVAKKSLATLDRAKRGSAPARGR
ncbi:hypothetical protein AXK56_17715 [Tsukamurella pulmonis]|uniref:Translation initiation factor n=1 Tax=Tsukamurella pulmonis TaxID=47312 RepID=A0A1H1HQB0_9ACTN|nr:hypothetical protein [Tsukamurella pulmonis]KXO94485.1 hypothetical protein AXK56_17715 [Tsukamurella pulmonis]SDR27549.1 hypothetical protein SAMN04489765_4460 [Tsukamurella pulmonis]SUP13660.1 Uncharacterised protein [Tsukamurella pulmonis]